MFGQDTIARIVELINAQSVYNTARTTTPVNLGLEVYNQAKDMLCMEGMFRDLMKDAELTLDTDNKITMPSDYGKCDIVYVDNLNQGKPTQFFYRDANDISERYTEEVTVDGTTGAKTIKFCFPNGAFLYGKPHVVYASVIDDATQADIDAGTKYSFFPKNLMLAAARKVLQDFYGISANQDPNRIESRYQEELAKYQKYTTDNNDTLTWEIHDKYGNNVRIQGAPLDGSRVHSRPMYDRAMLISGGAW
jgi:hypothetical protein